MLGKGMVFLSKEAGGVMRGLTGEGVLGLLSEKDQLNVRWQ